MVDRGLQELRNDNRPFGGMVAVLGGDWRQILPVVVKGDRPEIVSRCFKLSPLYGPANKLSLKVNMRAQLAGGDTATFAKMLLQVGNGEVPTHPNVMRYGQFKIRMLDRLLLDVPEQPTREELQEADPEGQPRQSTVPEDEWRLTKLLEFVFADRDAMHNNGRGLNRNNSEWICARSVLAPTNKLVDVVNKLALKVVKGRTDDAVIRVFRSQSMLVDEEDHRAELYAPEFLQTVEVKGWPPVNLRLREGMPVMLTMNFDPRNGHVNGTKYTVDRIFQHTLFLTRARDGEELILPRVILSAPDDFAFR